MREPGYGCCAEHRQIVWPKAADGVRIGWESVECVNVGSGRVHDGRGHGAGSGKQVRRDYARRIIAAIQGESRLQSGVADSESATDYRLALPPRGIPGKSDLRPEIRFWGIVQTPAAPQRHSCEYVGPASQV